VVWWIVTENSDFSPCRCQSCVAAPVLLLPLRESGTTPKVAGWFTVRPPVRESRMVEAFVHRGPERRLQLLTELKGLKQEKPTL